MRGLMWGVSIAAMAFNGVSQAQQSLPKEELRVLAGTMKAASTFSWGQMHSLTSCLKQPAEVDRIVCLKREIGAEKAKFDSMMDGVERIRPLQLSKSKLIKGAAEAVLVIADDVVLIRDLLEICSRKLVARDQLTCLSEVDDIQGSAVIGTLRMADPVLTMLQSLTE
ncbi:MAG: hypothetical protein BGP04_13070 [Rhizobiales bacterium 62-17]|nr:hypothetical protein [Hyphomicrobiales bacterium]OJY02235.1 MAG: hypothetical protein BGP04_13070 [Rhizobiales bacterium 62-17]